MSAIDSIVSGALGTLLAQGTGWALAVLLGILLFLSDRRATKERDEADVKLQEQYQKRIDEFREILDVMSRNTSNLSTMQGSITATSEAINQLAQAFAKLLQEFQGQQARWDDRGGSMIKQLEDVQRRLESLQMVRGAA